MTGYLALELRRTLRERRFMATVVAWPVASYLLFSTVFGTAADRAEGLGPKTEIMVAMATFGAIGAVLMATGPRIAAERQSGWTRQLRITPLSARGAVAARLAAAVILTLPSTCATFAAAALVQGVRLAAWEWASLLGLLLVGCIPFAAIGVVIGGIADGDSAAGATMAAYLAMASLGGLWMPVRILPPALRSVAHVLPSYRLAELGWRVAAGGTPPLAAVLVLAGWLVAAAGTAVGVSRMSAARPI